MGFCCIKFMGYVVYKHTAPNGKVYIGITCRDPEERWANGKGYNGQYFGRAVKKYGWENFSHEILFSDLTKEQACEKEIELISFYNSTNPKKGYNLSTGGENSSPTKQTREKISKTLTGKMVGDKNPFYGKHHPKEMRDKFSAERKGKFAKEKHPLWGKKHSEGAKEKMRNKRSCRSVVCVETGKIFISIHEAARETGSHFASIQRVCCGKQETANGFHWNFIDCKTEKEVTE